MKGERFKVLYHLTGTEKDCLEKAETICLEQTVELSAADVMFLIGGGLFERSDDLVSNTKHFLSLVHRH